MPAFSAMSTLQETNFKVGGIHATNRQIATCPLRISILVHISQQGTISRPQYLHLHSCADEIHNNK